MSCVVVVGCCYCFGSLKVHSLKPVLCCVYDNIPLCNKNCTSNVCRVNRVCECDWLSTEFPTRRRIVASVLSCFFRCCRCFPKVVLCNLFSCFFALSRSPCSCFHQMKCVRAMVLTRKMTYYIFLVDRLPLLLSFVYLFVYLCPPLPSSSSSLLLLLLYFFFYSTQKFSCLISTLI